MRTPHPENWLMLVVAVLLGGSLAAAERNDMARFCRRAGDGNQRFEVTLAPDESEENPHSPLCLARVGQSFYRSIDSSSLGSPSQTFCSSSTRTGGAGESCKRRPAHSRPLVTSNA